MSLRDRNTVRMVAAHWECCANTVYRRIADGSLDCLRLGGLLRVSRDQVEAYERGNVSQTPAEKFDARQWSAERGFDGALQREQRKAYERIGASIQTREQDAYEPGRLVAGRELKRKQNQRD